MGTVTLKIQRFDPDKGQRSYWATYTVEVDDKDRLLDVLNTIKWTIDGSLTFRRSCLHGVCWSDAMCVNGHNRLACKQLMQELPAKITIQPLGPHPHAQTVTTLYRRDGHEICCACLVTFYRNAI